MTSYDKVAYEAAMQPVRRRYVDRLRRDLARLSAHRSGMTLESEELRILIHGLRGSAGIFGFMATSRLAAELDQRIASEGVCDDASVDRLITELECVVHGDEEADRRGDESAGSGSAGPVRSSPEKIPWREQ